MRNAGRNLSTASSDEFIFASYLLTVTIVLCRRSLLGLSIVDTPGNGRRTMAKTSRACRKRTLQIAAGANESVSAVRSAKAVRIAKLTRKSSPW